MKGTLPPRVTWLAIPRIEIVIVKVPFNYPMLRLTHKFTLIFFPTPPTRNLPSKIGDITQVSFLQRQVHYCPSTPQTTQQQEHKFSFDEIVKATNTKVAYKGKAMILMVPLEEEGKEVKSSPFSLANQTVSISDLAFWELFLVVNIWVQANKSLWSNVLVWRNFIMLRSVAISSDF